MDRIHLVNSFAGKAAFSVQILIGVRDSAGVNVKARLARVNGRQPRAGRTLHTHSHARLQDAVTGDHDVLFRIDNRPVERMSHRSDHAMRGSAWKLGIRIERKHKLNPRKNGQIADLDGEAVVMSAEKPIQIHELPALALPAHPSLLARVVNPVAMQQEE